MTGRTSRLNFKESSIFCNYQTGQPPVANEVLHCLKPIGEEGKPEDHFVNKYSIECDKRWKARLTWRRCHRDQPAALVPLKIQLIKTKLVQAAFFSIDKCITEQSELLIDFASTKKKWPAVTGFSE